jgi:N-carbamoyl-L-amino-acid hydrolase
MSTVPASDPALRADLRSLAERIFADARALSADRAGVTRKSFGPEVNAIVQYLVQLASREGLESGSDGAANAIFSMPGAGPRPALWCGSHLDSVPQGGNYDGLAGVVAGLLCLIRLKREHINLPRPFKVMGIQGEEGAWFGKGCMSSYALFGRLSPADLALPLLNSDRTLGQCMAAAGADMRAIQAQQPLVRAEEMAGYIELHIEQGPIMAERGYATAVVPAIRGSMRHSRIQCLGEAGHSGAVPRAFRHDTVFAFSDLIMRIDRHWQAWLQQGRDLVVTTGIIGTDPSEHSVSRIPGSLIFSLDIRSQSVDTMKEFYQLIRAECDAIGQERGVQFIFDRTLESSPAIMDPRWCESLLDMSQSLGLPRQLIPSGAGHDAVVFAAAGIPSAMIFIRNDHGSHNPAEAMDIDDFLDGVELMYRAIQELP